MKIYHAKFRIYSNYSEREIKNVPTRSGSLASVNLQALESFVKPKKVHWKPLKMYLNRKENKATFLIAEHDGEREAEIVTKILDINELNNSERMLKRVEKNIDVKNPRFKCLVGEPDFLGNTNFQN